jgi:tRNA G10  N-methylase Trm11
MSDSIVILGRQPSLGLAEVESLYGADRVLSLGAHAARVSIDPCQLAFDRLGGSVKFCRPLTTLDSTNVKQIEKYLLDVAPSHSQRMPEGKMHLGLSLVGFPEVSNKRILSLGLNIKKAINQQTGRTVRLVPNNEAELSSAQVLHNKLVTPNGWELVLIKHEHKTVIAQTVKVQDIESYTRRDRERPKRDTKVGMLPPKLAQIIINLAVGQLPENKLDSICEIPAGQPIPRKIFEQTILDPFCGTGVVLQEALLMGYDAYGTDLERRMVEYSQTNVQWLSKLYESGSGDFNYKFEAGDATTYQWDQADIDFVACESYLGRPFTSMPSPEILSQTASECNLIIKKFLRNIHSQLKPGARLCLAVPAWQTKPNTFKHLPLLDSLEEIGYNRVSFEHARDDQLIYFREDQIVARQLLILTSK